jgi:hypothetical protein
MFNPLSLTHKQVARCSQELRSIMEEVKHTQAYQDEKENVKVSVERESVCVCLCVCV